MAQKDDVGFVYFIREPTDGSIKIGKARDAMKRLRSLQTSAHKKLELLAVIPGYTWKEQELHRRFAKARESGEWFRPVPDLLAFIDGVLSAGTGAALVAAAADAGALRLRVRELEDELWWHRHAEQSVGLSHRELVKALLAEELVSMAADRADQLRDADEAIDSALGEERGGPTPETSRRPGPALELVARLRLEVQLAGDIGEATRAIVAEVDAEDGG